MCDSSTVLGRENTLFTLTLSPTSPSPLRPTLASWVWALFFPVFPLELGRALTGCLGLNGTEARRRRSPWDFPRVCFPTPTSAVGVQSRLTQSLPHCLFPGDLWVTVSVRDFATPFCRNLERRNQLLPVPSPSATISDTPQRLVLGYPVTSKEDARFSGPSSGDHLSLKC